MKKEDLCIPVYLNQAVIFDSLAIIEDGFSNMKKIQNTSSESDTKAGGVEASVNANAGFNNIFSLFSIGIKGNYRKENQDVKENLESFDKVHTPTSLFHKYKEYLYENDLITEIKFEDNNLDVKSGAYVEFQGEFIKNPIIESIENIRKLMDLVYLFSPESLSNDTPNPGGGKKKRYDNKKPEIIDQINGFEKALTINDIVDIIVKDNVTKLKSVLMCEKSYFLRNNYNLVADGEYRVLGKVINVFNSEDEHINLLRMTSINRISKDMILQMFSGFSDMGDSGIDLPKIETEIPGPCMQIMPIGIYL